MLGALTLSQGTQQLINGTMVAELGRLNPFATATATWTMQFDQAGAYRVLASAVSSLADIQPVNNQGAATVLIVEGPPRPVIEWQRTDGAIDLSWPAAATGFVLEETDTLTPPIEWRPSTNAVVLTEGRFRVHIDITEGTRFFRLNRR